jgi:hypothetical protein
MRKALFLLALLCASFAIVPGQQDSPTASVVSCEGHRILDQVYYDVTFMNTGSVSSNFRVGEEEKISGNVAPGEEETVSISFPLPFDVHSHHADVPICVGGYLSYERCISASCSFNEEESPPSEYPEECAPAFILLGMLGLFLKRV